MSEQAKYCIVGGMCSGKSTVAQFLKLKHPTLVRMAFADRIKELCIELFDMDPNPVLKDRKMLQYMGTACREYDTNCWIRALEKKINVCKEPIVVDDCRYQNEFSMLKKKGFVTIKLKVRKKTQTERLKVLYKEKAKDHINALSHESEKNMDALADNQFDYVFENNSQRDMAHIIKSLGILTCMEVSV